MSNLQYFVLKYHDFIQNLMQCKNRVKTEIWLGFLEIEINITKRLHAVLSILNKQTIFTKFGLEEHDDECIKDEEETDASIQFLNIQNWLIWFQQLER